MISLQERGIQIDTRPNRGFAVLSTIQRMAEKGHWHPPYHRVETRPEPHVVFDAFEYHRSIAVNPPNGSVLLRREQKDYMGIMHAKRRHKDPSDF